MIAFLHYGDSCGYNPVMSDLLRTSLRVLEDSLPASLEAIYAWNLKHGYDVERIGKYSYISFAIPLYEDTERLIVFVYADGQLIADFSGFHGPVGTILSDTEFIEVCRRESDWMDLEQLVFMNFAFDAKADDEVMLVGSSYVSLAWRRQGIFREMERCAQRFALRTHMEECRYICVFSLDPDVPCYGPDAVDEPYVYSFERDEPLRNRNMQILEKLGYQEYDVDFGEVGADGAKHRFAWKSEMVAAEEAGQA